MGRSQSQRSYNGSYNGGPGGSSTAELEDMFVAAQKEIVEKLNDATPDSIKFEVYGYYKQAMEGDIRAPRPDPWNTRDVAKWNAWAQHRGMSKPQAIEAYIQLARRIPYAE